MCQKISGSKTTADSNTITDARINCKRFFVYSFCGFLIFQQKPYRSEDFVCS